MAANGGDGGEGWVVVGQWWGRVEILLVRVKKKLTGFLHPFILESFSPSCQITSMPGAILPDSAPIKIKNGLVSVSHLSKKHQKLFGEEIRG